MWILNPESIRHGGVDAKEPGLYSIPYSRSEEVVVFNNGKRIPVRSAADLYGETVGTIRGFAYPMFDQAFAEGKINAQPNNSQKILVQQLLKGRFDQVLLGKATIEYMKKSDPPTEQSRGRRILSVSADVMMRIHPRKAELLPRLNKALKAMAESGEIQNILDRYR